jgi:rubrerythrin
MDTGNRNTANNMIVLKGTHASNDGSQTAWQCEYCGAVIAVTGRRGKPLGDCPSCDENYGWTKQEIPIAIFDNE